MNEDNIKKFEMREEFLNGTSPYSGKILRVNLRTRRNFILSDERNQTGS